MKVTYNWLKEFVDINLSPEEVAEKFTNAGMEIEEIIYQDKYLKNVVVGKVLKISTHPNAEKLTVCDVDIGNRTVKIITSAKNIKENDFVPVSLPGAKLANGINIEKSVLRGVESDGMFCGGEELGLTEDYYKGASFNGILVLSNNAICGTPIATYLGLDDVVFDVNVTANRPDCMSVFGLAKELSAITKTPLNNLKFDYITEKEDNIKNYISVKIDNKKLCRRYIAVAVKNLNIQESPLWVKKRLNAVGIKSINNLVDLTNYVLIEYGQPMHAFDLDKLNGLKIVVRNAKNNEKIDALNHNSYELTTDALVVCDAQNAQAIAGIIGGTQSCVSEDTKTTILEFASFERSNIRRTSRRIGVRTDSAARFEKGVDVNSPEIALNRALNLISKLNIGCTVDGIIDEKNSELKDKYIDFSLTRIFKILGLKIDESEVIGVLNNLGLNAKINGDKLTCFIPVCRADIENEADIAEELIRIHGYNAYDAINSQVLEHASYTIGKLNPLLTLKNKLKNVLCQSGYYEALNYSICPNNTSDLLLFEANAEERKVIRIANPLSEEISCLRTSMAHYLFTNIAHNLKRNNKNIKLFEIGKIYIPNSLPLSELPHEKNILAFVATCENEDFYTMKGIVEKILSLKAITPKMSYSSLSFLHPGISADIEDLRSREIICRFGKINPIVAKNYDISNNTYYCEINLDKFIALSDKKYAVKLISKFPIIERDLAVTVEEKVSCEQVLKIVKNACGAFYFDSYIFDVYRSQQLGNLKSIAFKFKLSNNEKTLTDSDINAVVKNILDALEKNLGAKIR